MIAGISARSIIGFVRLQMNLIRAYEKKQCCLVVNMSRNANDQGLYDMVKTRLTTKEGRRVRGKGRLYTCCQDASRDRLG